MITILCTYNHNQEEIYDCYEQTNDYSYEEINQPDEEHHNIPDLVSDSNWESDGDAEPNNTVPTDIQHPIQLQKFCKEIRRAKRTPNQIKQNDGGLMT